MKLTISELWSGMRKYLEINIVERCQGAAGMLLSFYFFPVCTWDKTAQMYQEQIKS
jgi:hypothetical protein